VQKVEGRKKKISRKMGTVRQVQVSTRGWRATAYQAVHIFLKFFYLKKKNSWKFGKWARPFGRMGVQHPHFFKVAPTFGSANSSKIHGKWRFHFFPTFFFPKFSPHLDLHIYRWDFCSMKNLIP
jgi:hypothetical protein